MARGAGPAHCPFMSVKLYWNAAPSRYSHAVCGCSMVHGTAVERPQRPCGLQSLSYAAPGVCGPRAGREDRELWACGSPLAAVDGERPESGSPRAQGTRRERGLCALGWRRLPSLRSLGENEFHPWRTTEPHCLIRSLPSKGGGGGPGGSPPLCPSISSLRPSCSLALMCSHALSPHPTAQSVCPHTLSSSGLGTGHGPGGSWPLGLESHPLLAQSLSTGPWPTAIPALGHQACPFSFLGSERPPNACSLSTCWFHKHGPPRFSLEAGGACGSGPTKNAGAWPHTGRWSQRTPGP